MVSRGTALLQVFALQSWMWLPHPYAPSWFRTRDWFTGINSPNRRVTLRLARLTECVVCHGPIPANSTGDHLIPRKRRGPAGSTNYLPLCRSCNSSKGVQDFLEWYMAQGRRPPDLLPDVICSYARLTFQYLLEEEREADAPRYLLEAVQDLASRLPSDAHRLALGEIQHRRRNPEGTG